MCVCVCVIVVSSVLWNKETEFKMHVLELTEENMFRTLKQ